MGNEAIYVVNTDMMCFWVDAKTCEPIGLGNSFYDPYAITDPPEAKEIISTCEWNKRLWR